MQLLDEQIEEFKKICEANGASLTMNEAREEARLFLTLCQLLVQPLPSEVAKHEMQTGQEKMVSSSSH